MEQPLIVVDPDIQSDTPVFAGTRVPARSGFVQHVIPSDAAR